MRRIQGALPKMLVAGLLAWPAATYAQPGPGAGEEQPAAEDRPESEEAAPKPPTEGESPGAEPEPEPEPEPGPEPEPAPEPEPEPAPEPEPEPAPERPPADAPRGVHTAWEAARLIDDGELSGAEAKASLALTQPGGSAPGHFQLARIRARQGRLSEARDEARRAVDADALYTPGQVLLVHLLTETGDAASAIARLDSLANREPDALGVRIALAEAQIAAGRPSDAMDTARAVLKRAETSVTAMKLLARAYLAVDNPSAAEAILERALELETDAEAYLLRGRIALMRDEVNRARSWFEQAVEADGDHPEALNNLGYTLLEVRSFEAAIEVLDEAVMLAPAYATAWLNLGSARRGLQRFDEAEAAWKRTLELDPDMAEASFNLGILYLENDAGGRDRIQRYEAAIEAFNDYKSSARPTGKALEQVDSYIEEAKLLLDREKQRKQQQLKQAQPDEAPAEETPEEPPAEEAPAEETPEEPPAEEAPAEEPPAEAPPVEETPEAPPAEEAPPGDEGSAAGPTRAAATTHATEVRRCDA
ncbi:MAG: tetratricopeptide repeat protein [Myxococcota bacterium]